MSNRIYKITVDRESVLATVKKNYAAHADIVREARAGYVDQALSWVNSKADELKSGKVAVLTCNLRPPKDYSKEYELAITMLTLHTEKTIELENEQVQALIRDEWSWTTDFVGTNMGYSKIAADRFSNDP